MRVLVCDPPPPSFERLLEERRLWGADRFDEVWDGVLVMAPAMRGRHGDLLHQLAVILDAPARAAGLFPDSGGFNIGESQNYRIPDAGLRRERVDELYYSTAAFVIEVLSPTDDTWKKLPFYADHDVDEVLIVDPVERTVQWLALAGGAYVQIERSGLIELGAAELAERIDWPPIATE